MLIILGAIVLSLIILFGAGLTYAVYLCYELAPSGKAYADESLQAIITTWSEEKLTERASPELRSNTSKGQLDQVFATFKELGHLVSYDGAIGTPSVAFSSKYGWSISATYKATATFQYGKADITIMLIRNGDTWQIDGFHLDREPFYFP